MPTIFRWHGWVFLFYSQEGNEPPHIHVRKDRKELKVWLEDITVARNRRCTEREINSILQVTSKNRDDFLERWHEHFGN